MKLNRSDITAFLALLVSLGALFVSIIEANIMRDQQEIMQTQQKVAVYPYLSQKMHLGIAEKGTLTHTIINKGLGPAKIKYTKFTLNGEEVADYKALKSRLDDMFPPETKYSIIFFDPKSYFITANETITVLMLSCEDQEAALKTMPEIKFEVEFCYCSIFEDCWSHVGDETRETCP
ncbi:MAG: hypothetical protein F6K19_34975 [Cyanothece sp. SIO1E1]|nr:hypothetical protein [Cyanothece sp. SIO1E1]